MRDYTPTEWKKANLIVEKKLKELKALIDSGAVTVDSALSDTSENPVQNKVITDKITEIVSDLGDLETLVENGEILYIEGTLNTQTDTGTITSTVEDIIDAANSDKPVVLKLHVNIGGMDAVGYYFPTGVVVTEIDSAEAAILVFNALTGVGNHNDITTYSLTIFASEASDTPTLTVVKADLNLINTQTNGTFVDYTYTDSVSGDTETAIATGSFYCRKFGKMITIYMAISDFDAYNNNAHIPDAVRKVIATIPSGYRPKYDVYAVCPITVANYIDHADTASVKIGTNGNVSIEAISGQQGTGILLNVSYEVED